MAIMESTKFLFNRIKNRIRSNPVFSKNIYYPFNQSVRNTPCININQDNDKVYVNAWLLIDRHLDKANDILKGFLNRYTYSKVLETRVSQITCMVIYEIQEDNIN